jgi:hypothetical protein
MKQPITNTTIATIWMICSTRFSVTAMMRSARAF